MASSPYYLNSGMKCVKYMLLTINFMFILTAILLILVGTTIREIFGDFKEFVDDHFLSPPALLVAVGCIMLIVSFFGCFGALKESTLLINVYGVFLFLMFILEIAAAIAAFLLQTQVNGMLTRTMFSAMHNYNDNESARKSVDFMQQGLSCCGVYDPLDWRGVLPKNNHSQGGDYVTVPSSCCAEPTLECEHFEFGCLPRMDFLISQSAMLIATGATTVAFVQLLGVLCAFMLAKTIRRNKSIRAARRWQMQQNLGIVSSSTGKSLSRPEYTQLEKSTEQSEPVTYTASSPSVN